MHLQILCRATGLKLGQARQCPLLHAVQKCAQASGTWAEGFRWQCAHHYSHLLVTTMEWLHSSGQGWPVTTVAGVGWYLRKAIDTLVRPLSSLVKVETPRCTTLTQATSNRCGEKILASEYMEYMKQRWCILPRETYASIMWHNMCEVRPCVNFFV